MSAIGDPQAVDSRRIKKRVSPLAQVADRFCRVSMTIDRDNVETARRANHFAQSVASQLVVRGRFERRWHVNCSLPAWGVSQQEKLMNRNLYIALIAGTVAMGGVALADEPSQQTAADTTTSTFTSLDADKDGKISPSEAAANQKVADKFVAADKNQDGYLDPVEFSAIAKS